MKYYMKLVCEDRLRLYGIFSTWCKQWISGFAPLFLRLLLGYEFVESGIEKLYGANWFGDIDFPFPFNLFPSGLLWNLAIALEIIGPIALIAGFATRIFSILLMLLTVVAIATVHWSSEWHSLSELWRGYAITDQGYGNYKLPLMYLLMLASLFCSGSGRLSADYWLSVQMSKADNSSAEEA